MPPWFTWWASMWNSTDRIHPIIKKVGTKNDCIFSIQGKGYKIVKTYKLNKVDVWHVLDPPPSNKSTHSCSSYGDCEKWYQINQFSSMVTKHQLDSFQFFNSCVAIELVSTVYYKIVKNEVDGHPFEPLQWDWRRDLHQLRIGWTAPFLSVFVPLASPASTVVLPQNRPQHYIWKSNCNFRIASLFGSYCQLIACLSPTLGIDTRCSQTKYGSYQSSLQVVICIRYDLWEVNSEW